MSEITIMSDHILINEMDPIFLLMTSKHSIGHTQ